MLLECHDCGTILSIDYEHTYIIMWGAVKGLINLSDNLREINNDKLTATDHDMLQK